MNFTYYIAHSAFIDWKTPPINFHPRQNHTFCHVLRPVELPSDIVEYLHDTGLTDILLDYKIAQKAALYMDLDWCEYSGDPFKLPKVYEGSVTNFNHMLSWGNESCKTLREKYDPRLAESTYNEYFNYIKLCMRRVTGIEVLPKWVLDDHQLGSMVWASMTDPSPAMWVPDNKLQREFISYANVISPYEDWRTRFGNL